MFQPPRGWSGSIAPVWWFTFCFLTLKEPLLFRTTICIDNSPGSSVLESLNQYCCHWLLRLLRWSWLLTLNQFLFWFSFEVMLENRKRRRGKSKQGGQNRTRRYDTWLYGTGRKEWGRDMTEWDYRTWLENDWTVQDITKRDSPWLNGTRHD